MLLFPPIPMRAIWFIPVMFALQLVMGGGAGREHVGHLGGVIVAAMLLRQELQRVLGVRIASLSLESPAHAQPAPSGAPRRVRAKKARRRRSPERSADCDRTPNAKGPATFIAGPLNGSLSDPAENAVASHRRPDSIFDALEVSNGIEDRDRLDVMRLWKRVEHDESRDPKVGAPRRATSRASVDASHET